MSNLFVLHLEPEPAVTDCWAQGAVPKVIAPPSKLAEDIDVLAAGDASITAASPRPPSSQSLLVFFTVHFAHIYGLQSVNLLIDMVF